MRKFATLIVFYFSTTKVWIRSKNQVTNDSSVPHVHVSQKILHFTLSTLSKPYNLGLFDRKIEIIVAQCALVGELMTVFLS